MLLNLSKGAKLSVALGVQLLLLLVIIIFKLSVLHGGTEVLLKLAPVDPRDPLRGDYMVIRYDISNVSPGFFSYSPIKNGDTVYVPLEKVGKFYVAGNGITKGQPNKNKSNIFIKGNVVSGGDASSGLGNNSSWRNGNTIQISYNIESYFIPEGTGNSFPSFSCPSQNLVAGSFSGNCSTTYAQVMVGDGGSAVLKSLFVNDKAWPEGRSTLKPAPEAYVPQVATQSPPPQESMPANIVPERTTYYLETASTTPASEFSLASYKNKNLGFSVTYPTYFSYQESVFDRNSNTQSVNFGIGTSYSIIQISNDPNTYKHPTIQDYAKNYSTSNEVSRNFIKINGVDVVEIKSSDNLTTTLIMRPSDKQVFNFLNWNSQNSEYAKAYNNMLQSLKFD